MHESFDRWRQERRDTLRGVFVDALARFAVSPEQGALLAVALADFDRRDARSQPIAVAHQLPLLIHCAIQGGDPLAGDDLAAMPMALTTALLEVGVDVLDHLADGELGSHWKRLPTAAAMLGATGFIGCLPHLAIAELGLSPQRQSTLHVMLAEGLARMGAGQQRDFSVASLEDATEALQKTGERYGLYASAAAHFSGASPQDTRAWRSLGQQLGAARQLASDCADVLSPDSRDLRSGVRTWPLMWLLDRVRDDSGDSAAAALLEQMTAAGRGDAGAFAALREALLERGAVRRVAWEVEIHCRSAVTALESVSPLEPAAAMLKDVIAQSSLVGASPPVQVDP